MTTTRKYKITTPQAVCDCINAGMSLRRAAAHLGVSLTGLQQVCCLFGWHSHGWSGPKKNAVEIPTRVNSIFHGGAE